MNTRTSPTLNDNSARQNLAAADGRLQAQLFEVMDPEAFVAKMREEEGQPESYGKVLFRCSVPMLIAAGLYLLVGR